MKEIKAKSIMINAKFNGYGCVNFDNNDQSYFLRACGILKGKTYDNVMYAKKNYSEDEEGVGFKYKVSSECIRHNMWIDEMEAVNENVMQIPMVLYNAISTPAMIERGYMFTGGKSNPQTLKKKSPVTITDAVEDRDTLRHSISFDFHSKNVKKENETKKNAKNDEEVEGSTSIYNIENIGDNRYVSKGAIDLQELQFISLDETYDRCAVNTDVSSNLEIYLDGLKRNIPNYSGNIAYYYRANNYTQDEWAERGILLSDSTVDYLTKDILRRIINVSVNKRNSMFVCNEVEITYFDENGIESDPIKITKDNIDEYTFVPITKYVEANEERIKTNVKLAEEYKAKEAEARSKANNGKKANKNNNVEE